MPKKWHTDLRRRTRLRGRRKRRRGEDERLKEDRGREYEKNMRNE